MLQKRSVFIAAQKIGLLFLVILESTSFVKSSSNCGNACARERYEGYMLGPVCQASQDFRYPTTKEEIVAIVQEATTQGLKVKAIGTRHSATDIICTDGIPIDMKYLTSESYNENDDTATFGAGATLYQAQVFLKARNRALKSAPSSGNITIAGAMGACAHGSSIKYHSTLGDQAIAMTVVDGSGNIRTVSGLTELNGFRVHLGLLGIILDVTFQTVPFYKILAHNYEISDEILMDGRAIEFARETDQIMMHWYPGLSKIIIVNWTNVDANTQGVAYSTVIPSVTLEANLATISKIEEVQSMSPSAASDYVNSTQAISYLGLIEDGSFSANPYHTEDGRTLKNPAVGDWDRIVSSTCRSEGQFQCTYYHGGAEAKLKSIDHEFSLPLNAIPKMARRLKDILSKTPGNFFDGLILRFSAASDSYMGLSEGRDTVHVGFISYKRANQYEQPMVWLPAYQTFLQSMIVEMKGRVHWGKSGFAYSTNDMINKRVSSSAKAAFISLMYQYDPRGIFLNNFGRRFRDNATTQDLDPRTSHCALQDNCICTGTGDCADSQRCTTVQSYNYRACHFL